MGNATHRVPVPELATTALARPPQSLLSFCKPE
jgi:hypothetical protein